MLLKFSPEAARILVIEQRLVGHERLRVINNTCNFARIPGRKNANGMLNRGQQVSGIAQENLNIAVSVEMHLQLGSYKSTK